MTDLTIESRFSPKMDVDFVPAILWRKAYRELAQKNHSSRVIRIALSRPNKATWVYETTILPPEEHFSSLNYKYIERTVKFLLWAWGGNRIQISNAPEVVEILQKSYAVLGERNFDYTFMGEKCFGESFVIENGQHEALVGSIEQDFLLKRDLRGCRIGFDLGGSDRKGAALIDGEVVYSEEIPWNPYFEKDPKYHIEGIRDTLRRAAEHLPRVDGIGGSAAGIYIDNEVRVASLFRGVDPVSFLQLIQGVFHDLQAEWGGIPFKVENDGDVTALAGALSINENQILGISMGTSLAAGYINDQGRITGWLNELAFCPIDYSDNAPVDEWSGDFGCGVQYFSQQGIARLIKKTSLRIDQTLPFPEQLVALQKLVESGEEAEALEIYETIGIYLGYTIALYDEFYNFKNLLILGRVSTGLGGEMILNKAREVLDTEFPKLSKKVVFQRPDEKMKRHGQAIAAASLVEIND